MMKFSNSIELITLFWLLGILSSGQCKMTNTTALNCTISFQQNINGILSNVSKKISGVNRCPDNYENEDIIEKCENLISREFTFDPDLYHPVVENITNVVYWNTFCAICNNETATDPNFTPSWYSNVIGDSACGNMIPRIQRSDVDDLYELTEIFVNKGVKLEAKFYDKTRVECSVNATWPINLINRMLPCLFNYFTAGQDIRLQMCQYAEKSGKICTKMKLFMDGFRYLAHRDDNYNHVESIHSLSEFNFTRGRYYVETGYPSVFYICEQSVVIYEIWHWAKISITVISLIFVIIYLEIISNKGYLQQSMVNKMIYSYMVGLLFLGVMLLFVYLSYPVLCVAFYLAQFLWIYHFLWTTLIFLEFCLLAFCSCFKCNLCDGFLLRLRYVGHCIFGLIIPLALPIVYYFGVLVSNENYTEDFSQVDTLFTPANQYKCPRIPDHSGVSCNPFRNPETKYYTKWLERFLFPSLYFVVPAFLVIIIPVFVLIFILIKCFSKSNSMHQRDHLIVLLKMYLIMGIHRILYEIYSRYGRDHSFQILEVSLDTICQSCVDFHGAIICVVLGFDKCICFILNKCGCKHRTVSKQDGNSDVEIN